MREIKDDDWNWNIEILLRFLREEVQNWDLERCTGVQVVLPTVHKSPRKTWEPATAAAVLTGEKKCSTPKCTFCKQHHASANCHVVTKRTAPKQILRKEDRCFTCLKQNHLVQICEAKLAKNAKCFKCSSTSNHVSPCDSKTANSGQNKQHDSDRRGGGKATRTAWHAYKYTIQFCFNMPKWTWNNTKRTIQFESGWFLTQKVRRATLLNTFVKLITTDHCQNPAIVDQNLWKGHWPRDNLYVLWRVSMASQSPILQPLLSQIYVQLLGVKKLTEQWNVLPTWARLI